jgi:geranylgeranyl diphosphate synthase, type I
MQLLEQAYMHFLQALDDEMRRVVDSASFRTPDFEVMLHYPLGWVDTDGTPFHETTGKRIRPILLLLCTDAAGGDWQQALPAAASVELLHNFSLIQDDSPTRHGRPTVWKVWGRNNAINAGDAMFTLSYIALSDLTARGVSETLTIQAWRVFNQMVLELTRGQHLDMRFETQNDVSVDEYVSMISGKTSALLGACGQLGALIGSGSPATAALYADFGLNLGIAFQIHDDILGIWGDTSITGKSAATDITARKKSLPVLYGLSRSSELNSLYEKPIFEERDVEKAVALLDTIRAREYAQQQEKAYMHRALHALESAEPRPEAMKTLTALIDFLFTRMY